MGKQEEEEEEDNRREAAIASTLSLQPNFKPVGVSHQQLSKFRVPSSSPFLFQAYFHALYGCLYE